MKQAVDYQTMIPVCFVVIIFVVLRYMVDKSMTGAHERPAESTGPRRPPLRRPDHLLSVRAGPAPVCVLVMLVEGVGVPEDDVTVRAGVTLMSVVEFVLVPHPVDLAPEIDIAGYAPVRALGLSGTLVVGFESSKD